ncbi:hypothetical protein ACVZHT_38070, partial [Vibrio diabolicus]
KEQGRNRYNLFSLDNEELQRRQMEMQSVNLVHEALSNQRLELFAQPIKSLQQHDAQMYFEILVRIRNGYGDYVSPALFIPAS